MEVIQIRDGHAQFVGIALAKAFLDDPVNCYVIHDEERRWKLLSWMFPRWVRTVSRHGHGYTTSDFAGAALWRSPQLSTLNWIIDQVRAGLLLAPFKLFPRELLRLQKVHREATRRMQNNIKTPHWVLDVLGVSPEHQGCGVARLLVTPILHKADEQKLPCYLITNKDKNIAIYNRFGFEVIQEGFLKGTTLPFYEMRRMNRE